MNNYNPYQITQMEESLASILEETWMPRGGLSAYRIGQIEEALASMDVEFLSSDQEAHLSEILAPWFGLCTYRSAAMEQHLLSLDSISTSPTGQPIRFFDHHFQFAEPVRLESVGGLSSLTRARIERLIHAVFPTSQAISLEEILAFRHGLSISQMSRLEQFLNAELDW